MQQCTKLILRSQFWLHIRAFIHTAIPILIVTGFYIDLGVSFWVCISAIAWSMFVRAFTLRPVDDVLFHCMRAVQRDIRKYRRGEQTDG